jgi:predicted DNA-binding protein (UPF0251 family)
MKAAVQTDPLRQALRTLFALPLNLFTFGWDAIRTTHRRKRPKVMNYPVATPWTDEPPVAAPPSDPPPVAAPWSEADEVKALLARGMTQQDAARELGISRKALRRRLAAAR